MGPLRARLKRETESHLPLSVADLPGERGPDLRQRRYGSAMSFGACQNVYSDARFEIGSTVINGGKARL